MISDLNGLFSSNCIEILSIRSKSLSFLRFWTRFTNSLATPSALSSSVTVRSSATVILPSLVTVHPGISLVKISTSSMVISCPAMFIFPSFSRVAICSELIAEISAPTAFMSLPSFAPKTLKLGLICLTISVEASSALMSCSSFTFISCLIKSATAKIWFSVFLSKTGIITFCSG